MTQSEKLDNVLAVLAEKNLTEYARVHDFYFDKDIHNELPILLAHIVNDGFATVKEIPNPEIHESYGSKIEVYRITSKGLHFKETSSYKEKTLKEQQNKFWTLGKKIAIALNGILLLLIAFAGLYISNKANDDKMENKQLERTIDSLNSIIKTIGKKDTVYIKK